MSRVATNTKLTGRVSEALTNVQPGTELSFRDAHGVTYFGTVVSNESGDVVVHPTGGPTSEQSREFHLDSTTARFTVYDTALPPTPQIGHVIEALWVWD
jgi:uncharacterized protein YijF (DUF1287 family)